MSTRTGVLTAILVVAVMSGLAGATALPLLRQAPNPALNTPTGTQAPLLQFRSQGHVLGFAEDRLYTVGWGMP